MRLLALLTLVLLIPTAAVAQELPADQAQTLAVEGQLLLIDVRHPQEWRQTGVASAAETVSIHDPAGLPAFLAKVRALADRVPGRPIALICATGVRSDFAAKLLRQEGYDQVFNVREGMMGSTAGAGWLDRGLPLRPCTHC
ncbi:rhodanese-like domain-containing protein [Algihabitans albus]|uniref:rhodanese-like domain-containing protein n=1 Tax=Algihabitans albus TaxID=2164067 RepID=UPI001ABCC89D|nr:rhodanese-like domain-containing protein [Algihabitans albus]